MTELAKKVNEAIKPYHPLEKGNFGLRQFSLDLFSDIDDSLDDEPFDFDVNNLGSIVYTINTLLEVMDKHIMDYDYWKEINEKLSAILTSENDK